MDSENKDKLVKNRMQKIAKCVYGLIPQNYGFVVLTFGFNDIGKELMYASNANREDIIKAMKEWIAHAESEVENG